MEDFVVMEDHLVEGVNGKISTRIHVLQRSHGGVKRVCLMTEWRVV